MKILSIFVRGSYWKTIVIALGAITKQILTEFFRGMVKTPLAVPRKGLRVLCATFLVKEFPRFDRLISANLSYSQLISAKIGWKSAKSRLKFPRGPNDQKNLIPIEIFDPDRNFRSRSKISISTSRFSHKNRAAVGGSLENFILARNFQSRSKSRIFLIFGPSGSFKNRRDLS